MSIEGPTFLLHFLSVFVYRSRSFYLFYLAAGSSDLSAQPARQSVRETDSQTDRWIDRQTDKQAGRQSSWQTDRAWKIRRAASCSWHFSLCSRQLNWLAVIREAFLYLLPTLTVGRAEPSLKRAGVSFKPSSLQRQMRV